MNETPAGIARSAGCVHALHSHFVAGWEPDRNAPAIEVEKKVCRYNYKETLLIFCAAQHIFEANSVKNIVTET